jgi:hypothetical protein
LVDAYRPKIIECYRLEEFAARAEGAWIVRDDLDAFRTVPVNDFQGNGAAGVDCVDRTGGATIGEVLVGHPELAAKGPEGTRHYGWIFNVMGLPVRCDEPDIRDSCQSVAVVQAPVPLNFPDAAAIFTRHEQVEVKSWDTLMVEGNPGMILSTASVWDHRIQHGGKR